MNRSPSEYVGQQVRVFRERRRWRQADLVAELEQLGFHGWRQSKVAKIENGQAKRIPLEDVFELAAALGCSPLYLFTPDAGGDDDDQVRLGSRHARTPLGFRQWVRGATPFFTYRTEEEQLEAEKRYFIEFQPASEWWAHRANSEFARTLGEMYEKLGMSDVGLSDESDVPTEEQRG
jgi:transcriptional regulator with XRE-family HTH domain